MPGMNATGGRLLVLGMYPIETPNKAAAVRIRCLLDEFEALLPGQVDHICGTIAERRYDSYKWLLNLTEQLSKKL